MRTVLVTTVSPAIVTSMSAEQRALVRRGLALEREITCHDCERLIEDHPERGDEIDALFDQIMLIDQRLHALSVAEDRLRGVSRPARTRTGR